MRDIILSDTRLVVLEDSDNDAEWKIGYVDQKPAVGDSQGRWYLVPDRAIVPQSSQKLVWLLQDSEWSCLHQMHWYPDVTPATSPEQWLKDGPVLTVSK